MRGRPYNGENSLLINGASPICHDVVCDTCKGRGIVKEDDETAVEYAGIVLWEMVDCGTCGGEGVSEVCR